MPASHLSRLLMKWHQIGSGTQPTFNDNHWLVTALLCFQPPAWWNKQESHAQHQSSKTIIPVSPSFPRLLPLPLLQSSFLTHAVYPNLVFLYSYECLACDRWVSLCWMSNFIMVMLGCSLKSVKCNVANHCWAEDSIYWSVDLQWKKSQRQVMLLHMPSNKCKAWTVTQSKDLECVIFI